MKKHFFSLFLLIFSSELFAIQVSFDFSVYSQRQDLYVCHANIYEPLESERGMSYFEAEVEDLNTGNITTQTYTMNDQMPHGNFREYSHKIHSLTFYLSTSKYNVNYGIQLCGSIPDFYRGKNVGVNIVNSRLSSTALTGSYPSNSSLEGQVRLFVNGPGYNVWNTWWTSINGTTLTANTGGPVFNMEPVEPAHHYQIYYRFGENSWRPRSTELEITNVSTFIDVKLSLQ